MFSKSNKPNNRIDSLIGAGTIIKGDITFSGGLRIDGEVHGNVSVAAEASGTLVLSEHARIEGAVNVPNLVVNGMVNGPICSTEFIELQSHARVTGDVEYRTIEMQLGAVVQGRLIYQDEMAVRAVELKLASGH
ncbi:MAG: polymer-forming cytoskeletal protein [Rhodocyclaceae bacterium]|nr:polymer-forming cytoskeletal protein [Rhodocyclaceae bacterium]MDZ4215003.1 polymer-forming cytoskeletal protein [Rhodocyclaceae bacterium]